MPHKRHHSDGLAKVAYRLRRLYPDYYTSLLLAAQVAGRRCTRDELTAAKTEADLLALAALAHARETGKTHEEEKP